MKTRLLPLSLALTAMLVLPAGAFSDVPAGAWYADAAQICVDRGLLKGTGADTFSPDNAVTLAEVMTVAVRLHYQTHGGVGDPPAAPDNWGTGSITTPTGAVLLAFNTCDRDRDLTYRYDQETPRRLHLYLTVTAEERAALTPAGGPADAVLTLNGVSVLTGGLAPAEDSPTRMEFVADPGSDYAAFNRELSAFLPAPATGLWYRDALWYAREHGLFEGQPMEAAFEEPAARQDLADWLCSALPDSALTPINQVDVLPDSADPDVLTLYRAGILTGVDGTGAFAPQRTLSRAELAAVLARVADPSLRVVIPVGETT